MKTALLTIMLSGLVMVIIFSVAALFEYNTPTPVAVYLRIDGQAQETAILRGHNPDIVYVSLDNTPFGDNVKVLKVLAHPVFGEDAIYGATTTDHVIKWLDSLGVTSYPAIKVQ